MCGGFVLLVASLGFIRIIPLACLVPPWDLSDQHRRHSCWGTARNTLSCFRVPTTPLQLSNKQTPEESPPWWPPQCTPCYRDWIPCIHLRKVVQDISWFLFPMEIFKESGWEKQHKNKQPPPICWAISFKATISNYHLFHTKLILTSPSFHLWKHCEMIW